MRVTVSFEADIKNTPVDVIRKVAADAIQEITHTWSEEVHSTYLNQGSPPGSWRPLAPRTVRDKRDILEIPEWILIRRGEMIRSYVYDVHQLPEAVWVTATNTQPYWIYHERGTVKMPKRSQLDPNLYKDKFERIVRKYFPEG